MKTKLSCETSLKMWQLKIWKRSFRVRLPTKFESWRCANEAFLWDILKKMKVKDVKAKLSCEISSETKKFKMWKRSFRARPPSETESWKCKNEAFVTSLQKWKWKIWKRSFRARLPSKIPTLTCENQAWTLAIPLRGRSEHDPPLAEHVPQPSRGKPPFIFRDTFCPAKHSIPCIRCLSKTHFMWDFPRNLPVDDVKTKLSCETSLRNWKLKMRKQSFCDFAQKVKVEDMKTKLSCETSFQNSNFNLRKSSLN